MTLHITSKDDYKFDKGWLEDQFRKIREGIVDDAVLRIYKEKVFSADEKVEIERIVYGARWKQIKIEEQG